MKTPSILLRLVLLLCVRATWADEGQPTFNRDIAPIIFKNCSTCHHSGQSAPFALMDYDDVARRSKQIVDLTESGAMPPWLPAATGPHFKNERRLSAADKALLRAWFEAGCPEGDAKDKSVEPQFKDGWIFGTPDLVVKMPRAFLVDAEGPDIYRNFSIPLKLKGNRYVRAVEFAPGNPRIVHHAFIKIDKTGGSHRNDGLDGRPGFEGMDGNAEMPAGQFLTWHPGEAPSESPEGLPWLLPEGVDVVLQMHVNRSGKPEELQSSVAFYFTDQPPTNHCVKLGMTSFALDFPAGATNTVITDAYKLPTDVRVLGVLPHAHYLARRVEGFAVLPDGRTNTLISIPKWDFRWQGSYRFESPLALPKGTTIQLVYAYDNSTNNVANPNTPPVRVLYGPNSKDEMCELWLQLLVDTPAQIDLVTRDHQRHMANVFEAKARLDVQNDPGSAEAHGQLGALLLRRDRKNARTELMKSIELDPNHADAHFHLGVLFRAQHNLAEAKRELLEAIKLDPKNSRAYGNLGFVDAEMGDAQGAESCFNEALRIDPNDTDIREALTELHEVLKNAGRR